MRKPMTMYLWLRHGAQHVVVWAMSEERARQWAGDLISQDDKPNIVLEEATHWDDERGYLYDAERYLWTSLTRPEERRTGDSPNEGS